MQACFWPQAGGSSSVGSDCSLVNLEEFVHYQVRANETYLEAKRQLSDIIIIIIKRGWQRKAGRERLTPYQSEDPNPTTPIHREKEEKGKTVGDKN